MRGVHARGFTSRIAEKGDGLPGTGAEGASRARSRAPIFTFVLEVLAQNIRELRVRVRRRRAEVWRPGEHNVALLTARDASFSTVQGHAPISSASFDQGRFTDPGWSPTLRVDARKRLDRERIELTETLTVDSFSPAIEFYRRVLVSFWSDEQKAKRSSGEEDTGTQSIFCARRERFCL